MQLVGIMLCVLVCAVGCRRNQQDTSPLKIPYTVLRATQSIAIDGLRNEPDWSRAKRSRSFVPALGGPRAIQPTHAAMLWDDRYLYVFVEVSDIDVYSDYQAHDDPLWKQDVVELFIDADGNGRGYVELQVNPNNAQFDAWFPDQRRNGSEFDWSAAMQSAVVVNGTANHRPDLDRGWNIEIAIPLAAVKGNDAGMAVSIPPQPGDSWRLNIVRGDKPSRGSYIASSWNPIPYTDFHALGSMLTVVFANK